MNSFLISLQKDGQQLIQVEKKVSQLYVDLLQTPHP